MNPNWIEILVCIVCGFGILLYGWGAWCQQRDQKFKREAQNGQPCIYYEGEEKRQGIIVDMGKTFTIVRDTYTQDEKRVFTLQIHKPWRS